MLKRVDRHVLRVPGLESAVKYYRDVLGLRLKRHEAQVASFELDAGMELVLHSDPDLPAETFYYLVEDVRDLYGRRELLQLQFVSAPQQISRGYRATVKDPFGNVIWILDRSTDPASGGRIEDAKAATMLFAGVEPRVSPRRELLVKLYQQVGRTADDLPYTPHFEQLYEPYIAAQPDPKPSRAEVWRHLLNLRKGGKLPKLGEARSRPPEVPEEARQRLREILGSDIGKRDRLPYTARFDQLVDSFNKTLPRPLSPHLVWRLIATLAK